MSIKKRVKLNDAIKIACDMYGYKYFVRGGLYCLRPALENIKKDSKKQETYENVAEV